MKALEIILRLVDKLLAAFALRKAQNERNELEQNPHDWFNNHFNGGMQSPDNKTDQANTKN